MPILYDFIFLIFVLIYLPYLFLARKFHRNIWQRLGFYPAEINAGLNYKNPIWLHAVSVGEVAAIKTFWERARAEFPSKRIIISTITKTGNELAKRFSNKDETVFYLPLDFSFIVNGMLRKIRPAALIIAETELWPNLIYGCSGRNIPIILLNGRISDEAFKRYRLARFALRGFLERVNIFCVRTEEDMRRFVFLGAPAGKVKVVGNLKFGGAGDKEKIVDAQGIKKALAIKDDALILIAGSTHKGEEGIVLEVFKRLRGDFANLHLIIAPRHIERAGEIKRLAGGLPVAVIDKMGALRDLYSISDVVFVGGSLSRHGGHNIIEPAIFSKPILFGPHMSNFKDMADEFLKNGAAVMVKDKGELETNCRRLFSDESQRRELGRRAKSVVLKNQGAVEKSIDEVRKVLTNG